MRKAILITLFIWLLFMSALYVAFSFAQAEFNGIEWEKDVREGFAFIAISALVLCIPGFMIIKSGIEQPNGTTAQNN